MVINGPETTVVGGFIAAVFNSSRAALTVAALLPSSGRHPFPEVIEPLTSIRFFLALGVVLFHYQLTWTLPPEAAGLLNRARLGVDVFFILSGFILTHVYLQGDAAPDYRRFIVARFARIYPAHLFILLAMLALVLGADLAGVALQAGRFAVPDFLMTLLLVQAWFPPPGRGMERPVMVSIG